MVWCSCPLSKHLCSTQISPTLLLQLPQKFPPLWSYLSGFFFVFFVFLNLVFPSSVRTPQRSSSGSKLRQTSSHVSHAGHQSTHLTPQRFNPLAPTISVWSRVTKQSRSNKKTHTHTQNELSTKSSSFLTSAASLSLSLHTDQCF